MIGDGWVSHYIGETVSLPRRLQFYRTPGPSQATNIRINALLKEHLAAGGTIQLDIITGDIELTIGDGSRPADLSDKATRRLLEHAALVVVGGEAIETLNR